MATWPFGMLYFPPPPSPVYLQKAQVALARLARHSHRGADLDLQSQAIVWSSTS